MTRLEKALAELEKAMGRRAFVVVYDRCHPENGHCHLGLANGGGYANALGLLTWAKDAMLHNKDFNVAPPAEKEGDLP